MTIRLTRRSVVLGTAAVAMLPLTALAQPAPSRVRALAAEWLDEQYAYSCTFRSVFHPGGSAERLVPTLAEFRRWQEARRSLEHKTDRLIFSPSVCRDDVVLKSAALGCFFAKDRLPGSDWAIGRAELWIRRLENDVIAVGGPSIRTWRSEYEAKWIFGRSVNAA